MVGCFQPLSENLLLAMGNGQMERCMTGHRASTQSSALIFIIYITNTPLQPPSLRACSGKGYKKMYELEDEKDCHEMLSSTSDMTIS